MSSILDGMWLALFPFWNQACDNCLIISLVGSYDSLHFSLNQNILVLGNSHWQTKQHIFVHKLAVRLLGLLCNLLRCWSRHTSDSMMFQLTMLLFSELIIVVTVKHGRTRLIKGISSAESSRSVRSLGKGVSGKPYPRLCNARRLRLEPGTFRSQAVRLYHLHQARPSIWSLYDRKY